MSNEYLRKSVADRRTGANLIGINVDTSNMNNLSPDFEIAFNQLEAFAKESDNLKIQNEKTRLKLEIAKSRLDFKEKYLSDPTIYSSQEKWDMVTKLYEEERQKAKKIIADSKYLSADEKSFYGKDLDIDFKKDWLDPMNKRNGAVIQERVDEATMLFETAVNNACLDDLYKTDTIDRFIKRVDEIYNPLINSAISTKGNKNKAMIKGVSTIEGVRLNRKLEKDILTNSLLTEEQKQDEIKKVIETLSSDKRINNIAENMTKEYGYDNYEKEYLKSSLKAQYENARAELDKKLYSLSVQKKTQKSLETLRRKQENKDNQIMKAIEDNDPFKVIKAITEKDLTTTEMTAPENSANLNNVYGYTMATFGDKNNSIVGRVVSDIGIANINSDILTAKNDKTLIVNTEYIAKNIIEPYISENYRNYGDDIAMRKDLGIRIKGLNPTVILEGKNNPLYYNTWDTLKIGKENSFRMATERQIPMSLSTKSRKRYNELLEMNINNNLGAFKTVKGNEALNLYLSGLIEQKKDTDIKLEKTASADYNVALSKLLENDDIFNEIKEALPILYKIKVSPINYHPAKLLPYKRQNINNEVEENEEQSIYGV